MTKDVYPNLRKITQALTDAFISQDPNVLINVFEFDPNSISFDVVSDTWEGVSILQRISAAVETIDRKCPSLSQEYVFCICPVTNSEFKERKRCLGGKDY